MRLYLVRHAKAEQGEPDEMRALTPDGRAAARDLGRRLAAEGVAPDAVLTSPLLRARETAAEIARATGAEVQALETLAPGTTTADVRAAIQGHGETVVVVGHQPDCGQIAAELSGKRRPWQFPPRHCSAASPSRRFRRAPQSRSSSDSSPRSQEACASSITRPNSSARAGNV